MSEHEVPNAPAPQESLPIEPDTLTWAAVTEVLGESLVAYVLNSEPGREPEVDDQPRQECLKVLRVIAARGLGEKQAFARNHLLRTLVVSTAGNSSWATVARLVCGGEVPSAVSDDAFCRHLVRIAIDLFPAELLPKSQSDDGADIMDGMPVMVYGHPALEDLSDLPSTDPDLAKLFPPAPDGGASPGDANGPGDVGVFSRLAAHQSFVHWSTGSGGGIQWGTAIGAALSYAYMLMRLRGKWRVEEVAVHVSETVRIIRDLAVGKRVLVPAVVSLSNLRLEPGVRISLPRGEIISSEGIRLGFHPRHTNVSAVVVTDVECKALEVRPIADRVGLPEESEWFKRWQHHSTAMAAAARAVEREIDCARLAVVLGSDEQNVAGPVVIGRTILNPLTVSGWSGRGESLWAPVPERILDETVGSSISEWARHLVAFPESLRLGSRRLLASVTERIDPLDGFVDAVICWENMVGTGEGETTFRVCAALSFLLEPDNPASRTALFKELQGLYRARSGLVHGSREPAPETAVQNRDRAIEVAVRAMREIQLRAELRDAQSSSERSRIILLGA